PGDPADLLAAVTVLGVVGDALHVDGDVGYPTGEHQLVVVVGAADRSLLQVVAQADDHALAEAGAQHPWLDRVIAQTGGDRGGVRVVGYHLRPRGHYRPVLVQHVLGLRGLSQLRLEVPYRLQVRLQHVHEPERVPVAVPVHGDLDVDRPHVVRALGRRVAAALSGVVGAGRAGG